MMTQIDSLQTSFRRQNLGAVAHLTFTNAAQRNPLSRALLTALRDELARIAQEPTIRAVVISGEGPVFSAGHDLAELTRHRHEPDGGQQFFSDTFAACSAMMQDIAALPQPVIAAVEGIASAAGCQLVASCDLAIAGEAAHFATPGVNIGLFCTTPMVALSRTIQPKHAAEMLFGGEMMDAASALRFGLVNRVVAAGTVVEAAVVWAQKLAQKPAAVLQAGKRAFRELRAMPLAQAYDQASGIMAQGLMQPEANEGIAAFLEKRAPRWPHAEPAPPLVDHEAYDDTLIRRVLAQCKTIAIVGASANPARPSFLVLKYLMNRGFNVLAINPGQAGATIAGAPVYARLADVPVAIDMVDIFRNSDAAAQVVEEALALQPLPKVIWMQLGVRHDAAARRAEMQGVQVIMNRCPKIEFGRLSGEIGWTGVNSRVLSAKRPHMAEGGVQRRTLS